MYKYIGANFYNMTKYRMMTDRIKLYEYNKPEWSFHSKGIWYEEQKNNLSSQKQDSCQDKFVCNIFGSSNFGFRSFHRDTEFQIILVTSKNCRESEVLSLKFLEERRRIFDAEFIKPVDEKRKQVMENQVPRGWKYFSMFAKNYL